MQKAIGKIKSDGYIGDETIVATRNINIDDFKSKFKAITGQYYEDLANRDPSQKEFINGWRNRVKTY